MFMRIIDTWHGHPAAQIDDLRVLICRRTDRRICSSGDHTIAFDGNRLHPGLPLSAGKDVPIPEYQIGRTRSQLRICGHTAPQNKRETDH